ncbi:MAG: PAS domain S-box protein [Candidatus Eisenbacteria bacterium]|nr:PAS domain S-box protein [Candidatus Eisenbacteria bacterium]
MKDTKQRGETGIKAHLEYADGIIATLRESFLVLDKNLRVISANQAFYTTFKVAEKDTIGRPLPDLGNRQWNIPKLLQLLKEIVPEKKFVKDYEVEHKFQQIGQRVMVLNARQLRVPKHVAAIIAAGARREEEDDDDDEEEELILIAIGDITERKRLQEELKESEERYRRAFETSRDGLLLVHKTKADILNSNASAQELLGYSQEEFLKKKLWEIGMIKNDSGFRETASILERDGVIHYEDTPVRTKEGLSINTEVFLVDKAKVIQCNIRNITERKETEEALRESEMRFKAIFNESTDGMLLAEAGTRRFFMCNPRICQMLGYTEEELMRLGVDDIHPEEDVPFIIEQFERQAKGGIGIAAGVPVKRKDGSVFYADVNASRITLTGKKYLLKSFTDITDSKKTQDELREKMRDLERFSNFAVDRELKMEELEEKVRELEEKLKAR